MTRWKRITLAWIIAAALPAAALAQTEEEPSFFGSLWSSIKQAGSGTEGDDTPAAPTPAEAPSLSSARWIGFTPVLVGEAAAGDGAWIAGPFVETGATGWVTDTVSGLTVQVRLIWREVAEGSLAELSAEAGERLGLTPGAVKNVTIYLAR